MIAYLKSSIVNYWDEKVIMSTNSNEKIRMKTEYRESKLPARLLPISEVARFFGVHCSTVRRWGKKGLLRSYAIGLRHDLRFKQEDVLRFLDKCQEGSANGASLNDGLNKGRQKVCRTASFEEKVLVTRT
jgi:excisionase family DNA binding protein